MTPEGKVKDLVKSLLAEYHIVSAAKSADKKIHREGWYYMPVQNGMGVTAIPDFLGVFRGQFFAIETKAPGKEPTTNQANHLEAIAVSQGASFAVDGPESLEAVRSWIHGVIDDGVSP